MSSITGRKKKGSKGVDTSERKTVSVVAPMEDIAQTTTATSSSSLLSTTSSSSSTMQDVGDEPAPSTAATSSSSLLSTTSSSSSAMQDIGAEPAPSTAATSSSSSASSSAVMDYTETGMDELFLTADHADVNDPVDALHVVERKLYNEILTMTDTLKDDYVAKLIYTANHINQLRAATGGGAMRRSQIKPLLPEVFKMVAWEASRWTEQPLVSRVYAPVRALRAEFEAVKAPDVIQIRDMMPFVAPSDPSNGAAPSSSSSLQPPTQAADYQLRPPRWAIVVRRLADPSQDSSTEKKIDDDDSIPDFSSADLIKQVKDQYDSESESLAKEELKSGYTASQQMSNCHLIAPEYRPISMATRAWDDKIRKAAAALVDQSSAAVSWNTSDFKFVANCQLAILSKMKTAIRKHHDELLIKRQATNPGRYKMNDATLQMLIGRVWKSVVCEYVTSDGVAIAELPMVSGVARLNYVQIKKDFAIVQGKATADPLKDLEDPSNDLSTENVICNEVSDIYLDQLIVTLTNKINAGAEEEEKVGRTIYLKNHDQDQSVDKILLAYRPSNAATEAFDRFVLKQHVDEYSKLYSSYEHRSEYDDNLNLQSKDLSIRKLMSTVVGWWVHNIEIRRGACLSWQAVRNLALELWSNEGLNKIFDDGGGTMKNKFESSLIEVPERYTRYIFVNRDLDEEKLGGPNVRYHEDYQFDGIYRYLTLDRPDRLSELKLRTLYDHEEHRLDSSLSFLLRYTYGPEVLRKSVHKFVHLINSHRAGKLKLSRQEVAAMMSAVQSIVEVELKISNRDASMFEDQLTAITADKDGRTHALKAYLDVDPKRIGKAMQSTSMDQQINAEVNDYINKQLPMNIALSAYTVNDTKAMVAMKKERIDRVVHQVDNYMKNACDGEDMVESDEAKETFLDPALDEGLSNIVDSDYVIDIEKNTDNAGEFDSFDKADDAIIKTCSRFRSIIVNSDSKPRLHCAFLFMRIRHFWGRRFGKLKKGVTFDYNDKSNKAIAASANLWIRSKLLPSDPSAEVTKKYDQVIDLVSRMQSLIGTPCGLVSMQALMKLAKKDIAVWSSISDNTMKEMNNAVTKLRLYMDCCATVFDRLGVSRAVLVYRFCHHIIFKRLPPSVVNTHWPAFLTDDQFTEQSTRPSTDVEPAAKRQRANQSAPAAIDESKADSSGSRLPSRSEPSLAGVDCAYPMIEIAVQKVYKAAEFNYSEVVTIVLDNMLDSKIEDQPSSCAEYVLSRIDPEPSCANIGMTIVQLPLPFTNRLQEGTIARCITLRDVTATAKLYKQELTAVPIVVAEPVASIDLPSALAGLRIITASSASTMNDRWTKQLKSLVSVRKKLIDAPAGDISTFKALNLVDDDFSVRLESGVHARVVAQGFEETTFFQLAGSYAATESCITASKEESEKIRKEFFQPMVHLLTEVGQTAPFTQAAGGNELSITLVEGSASITVIPATMVPRLCVLIAKVFEHQYLKDDASKLINIDARAAMGHMLMLSRPINFPIEFLATNNIPAVHNTLVPGDALNIEPGSAFMIQSVVRGRTTIMLSPHRSSEWSYNYGPQTIALLIENYFKVKRMTMATRSAYGGQALMTDMVRSSFIKYAAAALLINVKPKPLSIVKSHRYGANRSDIRNTIDTIVERLIGIARMSIECVRLDSDCMYDGDGLAQQEVELKKAQSDLSFQGLSKLESHREEQVALVAVDDDDESKDKTYKST